jgi:hypothetical protein
LCFSLAGPVGFPYLSPEYASLQAWSWGISQDLPLSCVSITDVCVYFQKAILKPFSSLPEAGLKEATAYLEMLLPCEDSHLEGVD